MKLVVVLYGSAERILEHFGEDIFKVHRDIASKWRRIILIGSAIDMLNLRECGFWTPVDRDVGACAKGSLA